jgi:hypothetical protein
MFKIDNDSPVASQGHRHEDLLETEMTRANNANLESQNLQTVIKNYSSFFQRLSFIGSDPYISKRRRDWIKHQDNGQSGNKRLQRSLSNNNSAEKSLVKKHTRNNAHGFAALENSYAD